MRGRQFVNGFIPSAVGYGPSAQHVTRALLLLFWPSPICQLELAELEFIYQLPSKHQQSCPWHPALHLSCSLNAAVRIAFIFCSSIIKTFIHWLSSYIHTAVVVSFPVFAPNSLQKTVMVLFPSSVLFLFWHGQDR